MAITITSLSPNLTVFLASVGGAVVEQLTHDPMFEDSNLSSWQREGENCKNNSTDIGAFAVLHMLSPTYYIISPYKFWINMVSSY